MSADFVAISTRGKIVLYENCRLKSRMSSDSAIVCSITRSCVVETAEPETQHKSGKDLLPATVKESAGVVP